MRGLNQKATNLIQELLKVSELDADLLRPMVVELLKREKDKLERLVNN